MNARMRSSKTRALSVAGLVLSLTVGSASSVAAEVLVRFVNGRDVVAREHWFEGTELRFTQGRGTVGVPRALVAAIVPLASSRKIGGVPGGVNATPLVAPGPIR